jgi:putative membrane-bound dehydrogenase-like protein
MKRVSTELGNPSAIGVARLVCLTLLLACMCGSAFAQIEEVNEKGERIIRQGGYVEKLDPNRDFKDRMPRMLPREPDESMSAFHLVPPFQLEQVAAEPLVCDPVALCFDEAGSLFVAEMTTYSETRDRQTGSIAMLEDTDGDGRFDKRSLYVDKLGWPTAVICYDGGVFVASSPDLLFCKDTDGDGRADFTEVVMTGFGMSNPNSVPNSFRWGLDGRIHGMASTSGSLLRSLRWEKHSGKEMTPVQTRGRDISFAPRTGELRLESGGSQFGMTYDDWGNKFESSNSVPIEMVMYDEHYIARNPYLSAPNSRVPIKVGDERTGTKEAVYRTSPIEAWRVIRTEMRVAGNFSGPIEGGGTPAGYFTGACGVTIYTGDAWPAEFRGNAFVAEGSGNLIHRMRLEPAGVGFTAHRTEVKKEFLTSDENWFRPITFCNGPDGTLYMADMYREVYEHPDAIPPSAKKYIDTSAGNDRGRVYRFVPKGFEQPAPVDLGKMATPKLVTQLEHTNRWHRVTASRLLAQRQDTKAVAPIRRLAAESKSPLGRMHALYALFAQNSLLADDVLPRLVDEHPRVREHAIRLAETMQADSPAVRAQLYKMTADEDVRVRYQLAFTLGDIASSQATAALAEVARQDVADRWVRLALLSSCYGRAGELFATLTPDAEFAGSSTGRSFLEELAEQAGLQKREDQIVEVIRVLESLDQSRAKLAQAAVRGLTKGLTKSGSPLIAMLNSDGGRAGKLLAEMIDKAKRAAADEAISVEARVAAVRSLATAGYDDIGDLLGGLLDSRQPQAVQMAALQTLSRFRSEAIGPTIVEAWGGFSPKVRGEAAEALFARPDRIPALLEAVADELILPSQLDPARVQLLLNHPDETIRKAAVPVLAGTTLARREEIVQSYQDVLKKKGDVAKGRDVFRRDCAKCHLLEGVGYDLGLPLTTIQNRGPEAILLAALDPNRDVLPEYLNYVVITDDGLTATGMIETETATSITLRRAEGESDTILRANIEEMANTGLSIMPEGLEEQVSKDDMADLIAYLMSLQ